MVGWSRLSNRELGDAVNFLLMKLIKLMVADARVATFVVIMVKIVSDAGLGISQVLRNGPVPGFEFLRFKARPQAFNLWALS